MTVETITLTDTYTGTGSQATFDINFPYVYRADVKVYVDGILQTYNTHYSIAEVPAGAKGVVTFLSSIPLAFDYTPAAGAIVLITRATTKTQNISFADSAPTPAASFEEAVDRCVMMVQELQKEVNDALDELIVIGGVPLAVTINNNATATAIPSITVDSSTELSANIFVTARRKTDSEERLSSFDLKLIWSAKDSEWKIGKSIATNLSESSDRISFAITTVGTVGTLNYTTNNMSGANYTGSVETLVTKLAISRF